MAPWTHKKRKSGGEDRGSMSSAWDDGIEMVDLRVRIEELEETSVALHSSFKSDGIFNMMQTGDRRRLAEALYQGDYLNSISRLREQNSELVEVLRRQFDNTARPTELSQLKTNRHIDGILLDICRSQNSHLIPELTAALSLLAECNHVSREFYDACKKYHRGALLSDKWVRDFLKDARKWRPVPSVEMLVGVAVSVFDNLTMYIGYKSYSSMGVTGEKLDMTNWLSLRIPKHLAPKMDARKLCMCMLFEPCPVEQSIT